MCWVSRIRVVSSPAARSGGVAGRAHAHVHLIAPSWCIAVLKKKREDEESGCQLLDGRQRKEGGSLRKVSLSSHPPSVVSAPLHCAFLIKREERARNIRLVNSLPPARILLSPTRTGCPRVMSVDRLTCILDKLFKALTLPPNSRTTATNASYYPTLPNPRRPSRPVDLRSHRRIASEDGDDPTGGPAPRSPRRSFVLCRLKLPSGESCP